MGINRRFHLATMRNQLQPRSEVDPIREKGVVVTLQRITTASCFLAMTLVWSNGALAQGAPDRMFHLGLDAGLEYTDNVRRASANEESETVGIVGLTFGLTTDRPRLDANIAANLEYREYFADAYDSDIVGGVAGLVSYAFVPERFVWVLTDNFGQVARDRRAVDTPDNRENVNYFSTGPDITWPLTGRSSIRLSGRYSDTYYEDRDNDTRGIAGSLALIRRMSDTSNLSLNSSSTDVDYDEEIYVDYRIDQAFLRWETLTERTTLTLDGGYNRHEPDIGERSGGLLARLNLSRAVASRSRIGLTIGTAFETPGEGLRRDQDLTGIETGADDAISATDAYQSDHAFLSWTTDWGRTSFTAGLHARSEEHEAVPNADRDVYGASLRWSRQVSPRADIYVAGGYSKEEIVNVDFEFDEWSVGFGMRFQVTQSIAMRATVEHIEGSSEAGTRDFKENRAYIGFAYTRSR